MNDLRRALSSLDSIEAPDLWTEIERRATAPEPAAQRGTGRSQSMFSATKFVVAGALVALFGGFLLAGVLTTQSDDLSPIVGASPSAETMTTDAVTLPAEIPHSVDSGTLNTPLGPARWVHLRGDHTTLPMGLGEPLAGPSGGYITLDQEDDQVLLWRSPDLMTWAPEPLPMDAQLGGRLGLVDGTYWLTASGPTSDSLWHSPDTVEWSEVSLDGLVPPGPDGYAWRLGPETPLTHDGVTIAPLAYYPDFEGILRELGATGHRDWRLREIEDGVYTVAVHSRSRRPQATVRFEDTGSGLRAIDDEDDSELTVLDGVSMEFIERWTSGDEISGVDRLAILDEDVLIDVDLPDTMGRALQTDFLVDDSSFVAYSVSPDELLHVHRSADGREWIETDIVGDDPGEPSHIEYVETTELGSLVVGSETTAWISADGTAWEVWREYDGPGFAIGPGWVSLPMDPPSWVEDDEVDRDTINDTMWVTLELAAPIQVDASELAFSELTVNGGGSAGTISPNTIVMTQHQDEGARLREIWIITFDDFPA